ncbi:D-2-hydroxyacid dehydrogenase family protein [Yoonia sp.]|uniref:D-2-hydroxyacid dehydrogenase family protein n=1 Tax=Yoonia sp. TaxID=2212373 RepID=UPI00391D17BA
MRIAILDDWADSALAMADWDSLPGDITVFHDTLHDEDALVARLAPFEVICLMRERSRMPASLIARLPQLRLIVTTGMRNLALDVEAAKSQGIVVCGTDTRKTTASELAMTLLLAMARNLIPQTQSIASGGWQRGLGRDLDGMTLGLIGAGAIGAQMVERARPFGMQILAWSQNLTDERCAELQIQRAESLADLMARSDAISIHVVLSDRTRHLVDKTALAAMKPDAMLVNTSRGSIVDTQALLDALRASSGRRAALDVFDVEPLPETDPIRDSALIETGQLLLTPHIGYVTEATWRLFYEQTVAAIHAFYHARPVRQL